MTNSKLHYEFILIALVFIIIFSTILYISCRKPKSNNIKRGKMRIYGMLMNMSNKHLMAMSISLVNYLFLTYGLVFYQELNIGFILITLSLSILISFFVYKTSNLIFNIINSLISCLVIYICNLVYAKYILINSNGLGILLVLITVLSFIYFTYSEFISIHNIVKCHNVIRRKNNEKI